MILQEGDGPTVIPTLAKKITSKLAKVIGMRYFKTSIRTRTTYSLGADGLMDKL